MHPSLTRLMDAFTRREQAREGTLATEAEDRVKAQLARVGATALYATVRRNAHLREGSYAEAMEAVADGLARDGIPPRWSVCG